MTARWLPASRAVSRRRLELGRAVVRAAAPEQGDAEDRAADGPPGRRPALDRPLPGRDGAVDVAAHVARGSPAGSRRPTRGRGGRRPPAPRPRSTRATSSSRPRVDRDPRLRQAQARLAPHRLVAERVQPARDRRDPPALEVRVPVLGDELARAGHVAARDRVADRGARRAGRRNQSAARRCSVRHGLGPGARELVAEEPGEEMVVAVPLAAGVEREHEQPGALELRRASRRTPRRR